MRTDVKIGVAVGLLIVLAIVSYQVLMGGGDGADDANAVGGDQLASGGVEPGAPPSPGSPLPSFGTPSESGTVRTPVAPAPTPAAPLIPRLPEAPAPSETVSPPVTPAPSETVSPPVTPAPSETVAPPVTPAPSETVSPPVTPAPPITPVVTPVVPSPWTPVETPPITPVTPAPTTAERTYVVQQGDNGFWGIAEKEYGDGKYYYLIAKANPGASSNSLRVGSKLTIPPLPTERPTGTVTGGATPPGGVEIAPNGQRTYVVQKGDSGFWGIAAKQYGDGKFYYLIAKANPDVSSNALQPGDRLVLPPKPTEGAASPGGATITPAPGQKVYRVTKDDTTGFWGIAKREYGNGAYYRVLAAANPNANPGALKVGQQLIIPALTEADRRSIAGATTAPAPRAPRSSAPKRTDVEDIGELPRF